ncbi:MAG: PVC-type heme-binding CxxCH protein [Isosphaeraceae bacterium]
MRIIRTLYVIPLLAAALLRPATVGAGAVEIKPGDHISIIGNTLADRMQHDGWLETDLQGRFPGHNLVIRNLGFSGDELNFRLRSADFGTPDQWLARTKTDVVFAFFGYNESFAGEEGLEGFQKDFAGFIKHTLAQKYNGKSAPRLVVFSPIAMEPPRGRDLPDARATNQRLELYTRAMAAAARAGGVFFVDLFTPTRALYEEAAEPLTINGVHLNESGNRRLAEVIIQRLAPGSTTKNDASLDKLRQAVLDKNFHWFNRYRTVDGYSIFGGRADLRFTDGQTNRVVAQREMEVLDVMTANRDQRIWAVAQGKDMIVDDSNTPPFIPVKTNKPGPGPGGAHLFLSGEAAIGRMTVGNNLRVNLFASEREFPELAKPVQMSFDSRGRLWVACWPSYPHWKPKEEMNDKLLILEDTDGDGKADRKIVWADHLHCPTGFEFANGGVLVAQAPDLMFLKDTDGDDKADVRERVLSGLDSADTHHTANSFQLDPGGALYFQEGTFHQTQVETPYGPPVRCSNAGVFRYEPKSQKFDVYVSYGFANPHGHAFDRWGQDIVVDGTGSVPTHGTLFSGHVDYPRKHGSPPQVYQQRTRPTPGIEFLSSRHFPDDFQGNLLVPNVIGFQGILRYRIDYKGASLAGTELEPILSSRDPNFRPSDIEVGPDGAIYFLDWQNPIIGHMQHNLRDPSRDRIHGRVYRVTYEGRPLSKPARIAGASIEELLDLLKEPEDRVRYRARVELGARDSSQVIAALKTWVEGLDKAEPDYEHYLTEALWAHQFQDVVNLELLDRVLASPDFHARAAATRVLCVWRDRVPKALDTLKKLAADPYPLVRLEAIRAASFFPVAHAVEIPLISADQPTDEYLDYIRGETMKTLLPYWRKAVAAGKPIAITSEAGTRFFLGRLGVDELLKMKRTRGIDIELLRRKGVREEARREALADLAKIDKKPELALLIEAVTALDDRAGETNDDVAFDLSRLITGRDAALLTASRPELERLATASRKPVTRQLGYLALIAADGGVDRAWAVASKSAGSLRDLVDAMPAIRDPGQRSALYPRILPLLAGMPQALGGGTRASKGTEGRFVRIELRGRRTLTLAEVEVSSDGRNVAPLGKATQKNTAYGGDAERAIDGNKSGSYGAGGQTHTQENTANPWWEVDLGALYPIDSVAVWNRTEGDFYTRLSRYTIKILDESRNVVFEARDLPARRDAARTEVAGSGIEGAVRRAAMVALTSVRGKEAESFKALAKFVRGQGADRTAAIQAIARIPAADWPAEDAGPTLDFLLAYIKTIPPRDRTSASALDAIQLGDLLAGLLPVDRARRARRELGDLGVRVIRLGTITDQMLFNQDRIAAAAGKPVEIVFENSDIMPHNFVVTTPGALEEIGLLAESTSTQPGALERNYVPKSGKILLASRLLAPRDSQKLSFTAPINPGVYPYVCTYPGHWRRMYGAFYVVEDISAYLADPPGYLAAHPLPILDELLKNNRPRKEWAFDDLASSVEGLNGGRSFATGKQIFEVASCVSCHRLNGVGEQIGPDLAQLDAKTTRSDILRSLLEPSAKIDEKYQTHIFTTKMGTVITGMILEENAGRIKLIENPLARTAPVLLDRADIEEHAKSPTSIMPKGLLDKLTKQEILDLIAYIAARGNARVPLFQGQHEHNH